MKPAHRRPKSTEVVLILWGAGGDEAAAVIFIRALRMAGRMVKLVGLGGTAIKGEAGVVLVPDMALGEALSLANRAVIIMLPFCDHALKHFVADPRLGELIAIAHATGATFLQSELIPTAASLPALFPPQTPYRLISYPAGAALHEFVASVVEESVSGE